MSAIDTTSPRRWRLSPRRSVPRFLPPSKDIRSFFAELNAVGCRYAVLRWFEELPLVHPGEDIDLLVHDDDVELIRTLLRGKPRLRKFLGGRHIRCDVYSVSGVRGTSYRGVAYYPPRLALRILEGAVVHSSGAKVPNPRDHFFSLAFHALYHKGFKSGIAAARPNLHPQGRPEHDYAGTLRTLAAQIELKVDIEMDQLDEELARQGWRPPLDFIERLLPNDPWAKGRLAALQSASSAPQGLAAFILRERVLHAPGQLDAITELLREEGFNLLATKHLSVTEKETLGRELRGANWGAGPWVISGGLPAVAIAAIDVFPKGPEAELLKRHPTVDNQRVFVAKQRIRDLHNQGLAADQRCNIVHSADNCAQALGYIDAAMPEMRQSILDAAKRLVDETHVPGEVVKCLSRSGRRAVVELIQHRSGRLAVRKRFRPGKEEFFERELGALKDLGRLCPDEVPSLLEYGNNYIIMPFYEDARSRFSRKLGLPLPVPAMRKAMRAAKAFFDHGYVLGDFRPHNLIVEGRGRIKIIDFEDAYRHRAEGAQRFQDIELFQPRAFDEKWGRAAGLSAHSLMRDPLWLLYAKRYSVGYIMLMRSVLKKAARNARRSVDRRLQRSAMKRKRFLRGTLPTSEATRN